ncbi:lipoprotein [Escherichia coli]|nr:lipoprotein [Escherichia coli]
MVKSQPILRYILRGIPAIAVAVLLSACSANNTAKNMHPETRAVGSETSSLQASQDEFENLVRNVDVKSRIMDQYADWKGVRYRLGGSTKKGIDCSGFVQRTFREQFGLELPRSTYEQQEMGKSVSRSNLRTGDFSSVPCRFQRDAMSVFISATISLSMLPPAVVLLFPA